MLIHYPNSMGIIYGRNGVILIMQCAILQCHRNTSKPTWESCLVVIVTAIIKWFEESLRRVQSRGLSQVI